MQHWGGTAWQDLKWDLQHKLDATLRWICLARLEQQTGHKWFMQSCINIACQGQDYVNIVNADTTLRQDVNVAWDALSLAEVFRHWNGLWCTGVSLEPKPVSSADGPLRVSSLRNHPCPYELGSPMCSPDVSCQSAQAFPVPSLSVPLSWEG